MKASLIPQKAPGLLCALISPDYAYAVNCSYPNSFRVLNKAQYYILNAINGRDDLQALAKRLQMREEVLKAFFTLLSKTELISFNGCFSAPQRPDTPQSLNFWIHTTNACNLGCSYCYISTLNTGRGMTASVRNQLLYKLAEAATKHKIRQIKLRLAGGEPLSQFKAWQEFIPEAKAALSQVGCKLEAAFITNLTILNDEIIEFAKTHEISFGVSIDGIAEIHDATRRMRSGAGTFDIVDKNLRRLLKEGIAVSVNTVVNNWNLVGLADLTKYLISLDLPFRYSIVKGEAIHSQLLEDCLLASYAIMQDAIKEGWQFSKRYQFCDLKPTELGFQTCASGYSGGAIYTDGSFKYCHVQFGKNMESAPSIFSEGLDLLEMIESGEHLEEKKSDDCKQCRYRHVCTSGCPVYRINDKDPQCSLYHKFIPKYYELQAKERLYLIQKCAIL